jgi:colanic acid biosynthesis glycosyl transferase WcaI
VPARPSGLKRIAHLASFALSSLPVILAQTVWRPHVLLVIAPTLLATPAAILAARLSGAKGWLHIQDFEVDAAFELGILKKGWIRKGALAAERWMLQRFDRVSTISRRMMDRLNDKRVLPGKTTLFPNWVDCREIHPLLHPSPYRAELGFPAGTVVAMYSGAMGEKQGFEVLAETAERLRAHPRLLFVFAGAGSGREMFHAATHHFPNVRWLPLQPAERLNDWLNLADIHLLPQRADAEDLMLPSKLIGMLASGRPIVAMARDGTQIASELKDCGIVIEPGSAEALARVLERLAADRDQRVTLGAQARELAVTCFDRETVLDRFEKSLKELVSSRLES